LLLIQGVFSFIRVYLFAYVTENAMLELRSAAYKKMISKLSTPFVVSKDKLEKNTLKSCCVQAPPGTVVISPGAINNPNKAVMVMTNNPETDTSTMPNPKDSAWGCKNLNTANEFLKTGFTNTLPIVKTLISHMSMGRHPSAGVLPFVKTTTA